MSETKRRLLLSKWQCLRADLAEAKEQIESLESERDDYADQLESVLVEVKYWLHRGLFHHQLVSDPRKLLRQIEDVL